VREGPNGACRIVDVRPTDTKIVIVGNKAYKARDEAEKEMMVVCKWIAAEEPRVSTSSDARVPASNPGRAPVA
jgi:hypothetical protein